MAGGRRSKKSKGKSSDDFKDPSQDDGARYIQEYNDLVEQFTNDYGSTIGPGIDCLIQVMVQKIESKFPKLFSTEVQTAVFVQKKIYFLIIIE